MLPLFWDLDQPSVGIAPRSSVHGCTAEATYMAAAVKGASYLQTALHAKRYCAG